MFQCWCNSKESTTFDNNIIVSEFYQHIIAVTESERFRAVTSFRQHSNNPAAHFIQRRGQQTVLAKDVHPRHFKRASHRSRAPLHLPPRPDMSA